MDDKLLKILSEILEVDEKNIDERYELNDENWTSISIISYMDEIFQNYDLELDGDELENILNVGDLVEYTFSKNG